MMQKFALTVFGLTLAIAAFAGSAYADPRR